MAEVAKPSTELNCGDLVVDFKLRNGDAIDPAIFNKQEARTEDLHLNLSEKYMIYKDYAERCMLNPQHIGKRPKSVTVFNIRQGG